MKIITFLLLFSIILPKDEGLTKFKKVIKESENDSLVVDAYIEIMRAFGPNKIDSVLNYGKKAIKFSVENDYLEGEILANHSISNLLSFHGEFTDAIIYSERAIELASKYKSEKHLAKAYSLLSSIYGRKGELAKATSYVFKSLKIHEKLNDKRGVITSYIKLSAISINEKDFKNGLKYITVADSLNRILKDKDLDGDIINNKAITYAELNRLDEALEMFKKLHELSNLNGKKDVYRSLKSLMNMGLVYQNQGQYDTAISYYRKSFDESLASNIPEGILQNLQNLSQAYCLKKDYVKSNKEGLLALEKSREMKVLDLEVQILEVLMNNYTSQKDYKNALKYTNEYYTALNKLDIKKRENEIDQLKDKYQLEKTEEKLKLVSQINETRTHQRNLSIVLSIIAFLSMIIFAYAYYRIRILNKSNVRNKNRLAESNYIKDRLFSVIGHDLRSAYTNSLWVLNMIKDKHLDEDEKDILLSKTIIQSTYALETLEDLLAWGNSQIKGGNINQVNFNSKVGIDKSVAFLSEIIHSKHINVVNNVPDNLPIFADQDHFSFLIRNLVSNAVKFTPLNGLITIGFETMDNRFYKFFVKDNGIGMTAERLKEIFTKEVTSEFGTENEQGTGLGLVLCSEFIKLNGGDIYAESEIGKGTTIYFTFKKGIT